MGDPPAGDSVSGGYKSNGESVSAQYGENVSGIVLFDEPFDEINNSSQIVFIV